MRFVSAWRSSVSSLLLFLMFAVELMSVRAQAQAPAISFSSCQPFIEKNCSVDEKGTPLKDAREILGCLRKNTDRLETSCQLEIERYVQTARQAAARGGGALGSFGGLTALTPPVPLFTYDGSFAPKAAKLNENRVSLSSPVAGSEKSVTSLSLSGGDLHFGDAVTLTNGQTLPLDLYRAEVGVQYSRRLEDKKSFGLRVSAGTTGDQVFQTIKDANFSVAATYGFPGSAPNDYWVALLYIANNSTLGDYIPLPGIIYIHKTERFTGVIGFPVLSLQWTPVARQSYSLSILGTTLITEAAFGEPVGQQFFAQGSFNQQKYILHDRSQDRDRLTFQERKLAIGYRAPLFSSAFGELQMGKAFKRSFSIGERLFDTSSGLADLDDAGFANVSLKYVF